MPMKWRQHNFVLYGEFGRITLSIIKAGSPAYLMTAVYALLDAENRRLRQIYLAHPAPSDFGNDAVMRQRGVG